MKKVQEEKLEEDIDNLVEYTVYLSHVVGYNLQN